MGELGAEEYERLICEAANAIQAENNGL